MTVSTLLIRILMTMSCAKSKENGLYPEGEVQSQWPLNVPFSWLTGPYHHFCNHLSHSHVEGCMHTHFIFTESGINALVLIWRTWLETTNRNRYIVLKQIRTRAWFVLPTCLIMDDNNGVSGFIMLVLPLRRCCR